MTDAKVAVPRIDDLPCRRLEAASAEIFWLSTEAISADRMPALQALLDPIEQARAGAFQDERDRTRSILAHALKRLVLARVTGEQPASLRFVADSFGRPWLAGGGVDFNISHRRDIVACAVSASRRVGIDVETDDPAFRDPSFASGFAAEELAHLDGLAPAARPAALQSLWVLREAFAKGTGLGLDDGDGGIWFELAPPRVHCSTAIARAGDWAFHLWRPLPGTALALAVGPPLPSPAR